MQSLSLYEITQKYGMPDIATVSCMLAKEIEADSRKIVVLDDDPTGIQTVHDVNVYTDWSKESLDEGFCDNSRMFYILTNSRSFTAETTAAVHREITENICAAAKKCGKDFTIISRGDSTLRGHYPLETEVIRSTVEACTGLKIDGEIIMPFFKEGGRYTIGNVHYVADGDRLDPVGQTEFALDKTFGYESSDLRDYIEEKTQGRYKKDDIAFISLDALRKMDMAEIEHILLSAHNFSKIIVNALDYCDVKVFCIALLRVMKKGRHFLFRTAAGLPKIIGGVSDRPLLTKNELIAKNNKNGGLIMVGSHVKKTTQQLQTLKKCSFISFIEFNQHLVLDPPAMDREVSRVVGECEKLLSAGRTVTVYTRRDRLDLHSVNKEEELKIAVRISDSVAKIVSSLTVRPSFIIAKGGITSSDIGVKALRVKKAAAAGQILEGIPVWLTGSESKFPGLPYIIFPGNVGSVDSLQKIVVSLCS